MTDAATRQRSRRRRQRQGRVLVRLEVSRATRDALVDAGRLAAWDEDSPAAVEAALQQVADDLIPGLVTA